MWPTQEECPACFGTLGGVDNAAIYDHVKSVYWPVGIQNPRIIVIKPWRGKRRPLGRLRSAAGGVFTDLIIIVLLGALGLALKQYWVKNDKRLKEKRWNIQGTFNWSLPSISIGSSRNNKKKDSANGRVGLRSYAPGNRMRQRYSTGSKTLGGQDPRESSSGFATGRGRSSARSDSRSNNRARNGGGAIGGGGGLANGRGSSGRRSARGARNHSTFMNV